MNEHITLVNCLFESTEKTDRFTAADDVAPKLLHHLRLWDA
jgi:hypothetical protein